MGILGNSTIGPYWEDNNDVNFTLDRRFLLTAAYAYVRASSTTSDSNGQFSIERTQVSGADNSQTLSGWTVSRTPVWKTIIPTNSALWIFQKGDRLDLFARGHQSPDLETNTNNQLVPTMYAEGIYFPTIYEIAPKDAVVSNPTVWYEQPPQLVLSMSFEDRVDYALNNGGYYKITVSKASMGGMIADTGWVAFGSANIINTKHNFFLSYKESSFPVLFTELEDDPDEIYTWTAQIRAGTGTGTYATYDITPVFNGSFLYTLENHSPGADAMYPTGTLNTVNPTILATFDDTSEASGDPELRHTMENYRIYILDGNEDIIADTGIIPATDIPDTEYIEANFPEAFTELVYSTRYTLRVQTTCSEGHTGYGETSFTTTSHYPVVTITAPVSGASDRTPQFVSLYSDPAGHNHINTAWFIYHGTELIAESLPGLNTLTPTYDHENATVWLYGEALQYGETYRVQMRAQCEEFSWSDLSTRTFAIAAYTPVATLTVDSPAAKVDTLTPTFAATYTSSLGNSKEAHKFEVWDSTGTIMLGTTGEITSSSSPFEALYSNVLFTTHANLAWGTQYILKVFVKDNEDIWNVPVAGSAGYKVFKTNSYPTTPTALSPDNGEEITSLTPNLTATFNDPDSGDTISVMEVEMREAEDNTVVFLRAEAQTTSQFAVFVSDGLEIDTTYQWRVRFTDQGSLQGTWSNWATFTAIEGATITFTNPVYGEVFDTPAQTFTWTYSHPSAIPQASGRLRIYTLSGTVPIYDTGIVSGSYLSQVIPPTLLSNEVEYRARVDVTDTNGEQANSGYVFFTTLWEGPAQPTNIYAFPDSDISSVQIVWDTVEVDEFREYRLYERDSEGTNSWTFIDQVLDIDQGSYEYYYAPSGRSIDYTVTVVSIIDEAMLESKIETFASATLLFPHITWFMDSEDPNLYAFSLERNPTRDELYSRQAVYTETLGRIKPVVHLGKAINNTVNITFRMPAPYRDTIAMIKFLITRGKPVLYKDSRGRRIWVSLHDYNLRDLLPNQAEISLDLRAIDFREF